MFVPIDLTYVLSRLKKNKFDSSVLPSHCIHYCQGCKKGHAPVNELANPSNPAC